MTGAQFKEILIFVAGSTPQIITETIQSMATAETPIYPDEIYVITTAGKREKIEQALIAEGRLAEMCREWAIPQVHLTESSFVIISDSEGNPLVDIRTADENELAGDQIAAFIRSKALDPGTRLHCSLAGGRRTMSFYMGLAFQLFARQWDKLYHVLVTPDFEFLEDFYYKPRENRIIAATRSDGTVVELNTDDAVITLTELPFICLRHKVPLEEGHVRELVEQGQRTIDSASMQLPVRVNLRERTLYIGDTLVELPPMQLTLYTAFLRLKKGQCRFSNRSHCQECIACFLTLSEMTSEPVVESMADDYRIIYSGDQFKQEDMLKKWRLRLDNDLRQLISKVNRAIREELKDETLLPFYLVFCNKKYAGSRYGVRVEKGKIAIDER